jgi:hypothetical protein
VNVIGGEGSWNNIVVLVELIKLFPWNENSLYLGGIGKD